MRRPFGWSSLVLTTLLFAPRASAQSEPTDPEQEALRRRILQRVEAVLAHETAQIRHEIEALLDRELGLEKKAPAVNTPPPAEREQPARKEAPVKVEKPAPKAERDPDEVDLAPTDQSAEYQELSRLFEDSMAAHTAARYDESIAGFKKIAERISDPDMKATAAYNVACGYALKGDKTRALRWLKRSIEGGFTDVEHMLQDTDLESLRETAEFKALIEQARKAAADEEGEEGDEKD